KRPNGTRVFTTQLTLRMARLDHLGRGDSQLRRFVVLYKVQGTLLGFVEHSSQVFADDAEADELNATQKKKNQNQRGETGYRIAIRDFFGDYDRRVAEGDDRGHQAEVRGHLQRRDAEGRDSFEGKVPELPVVPLGRSGVTGVPAVGNRLLRIPDPGEQALHEAMLL